MPVEILDVGDIGAGVAQSGRERMPNTIHRERLHVGSDGRPRDGRVRTRTTPRPEGIRGEERAHGGQPFGHERDHRGQPALPLRHDNERNGLVEVEVLGCQAPHLRRAHTRPVHEVQAGGDLSRRQRREYRVDPRTGNPPGHRGRHPEADDVHQLQRGAPAVEHLHAVRQRVAALVAARWRQSFPPLLQLIVQRRRVLPEQQRADVAEAREPGFKVALPIHDARQRRLDALQVARGIRRQRGALAGRQLAELCAEFVGGGANGAQRRRRWKAELAPVAVRVDHGGQAGAVPVEALRDPAAHPLTSHL